MESEGLLSKGDTEKHFVRGGDRQNITVSSEYFVKPGRSDTW
jgi:hypothetical protein